MKLSIKAFAITAAVFWGFAMAITSAANMIWPSYAVEFLEVMSSIYPGYETGTGVTGVVIVSLYGIVDAGIGAIIFVWLYNFLLDN